MLHKYVCLVWAIQVYIGNITSFSKYVFISLFLDKVLDWSSKI